MEASFVSQRRLGDVQVAVIDVATMSFRPSDNPALLDCAPWSWEAVTEPDGRVLLGQNVVVVRTPDATIVIDPCTFPEDPPPAGDAIVVPGEHLDHGLDVLGVDPAAVTHVLVTHAHEDHFNGILGDDGGLRFPHALHLLPEADWRTIVLPGHPFAESAPALRERLPLTGEPGGALLVAGEHEVVPGVTLLPTPGETEGHQIVRIETPAGRVYVLGDLVHWAQELEDPTSMGPTSGPPELRRRVLAETQQQRSTLVFTHAQFPPWGMLEADGADRWRWRAA